MALFFGSKEKGHSDTEIDLNPSLKQVKGFNNQLQVSLTQSPINAIFARKPFVMMNIIPFGKHCLLAALLLLPFLASAQLRLQSVAGKKTAEIPLGSTIEIKLPAPGEPGDACEYYWSYNGVLKGTESGKAKLLVHEETLMYQETNGLVKKVKTNYAYPQKEIYTDIELAPAFSVTKYSKSGDARKGFGALIIGAALLHSVAISPFLSEKARDVSDKIVWGGVGVGLTLILLPSKKTWYLQQPTGKNKKLWQLQ